MLRVFHVSRNVNYTNSAVPLAKLAMFRRALALGESVLVVYRLVFRGRLT